MKPLGNISKDNRLTTYVIISLLIGFIFLVGCNEAQDLEEQNTLADYIAAIDLPIQKDSLIACAASGQNGILEDASNEPVSVIYLPLEGLSDIRYFETNSAIENEEDFSKYHEQNLPRSPLLNGFLQKFNRKETRNEVVGLVSFIRNSKLFLSNPIHLKFDTQPTIFNDQIDINKQNILMPEFSWPATTDNLGNAIFFHVVSDSENNLISGTYTFDPQFQFYKLDNVVLNINDVTPPPELDENQTYRFTVMGVSLDNWVNIHAEVTFDTR